MQSSMAHANIINISRNKGKAQYATHRCGTVRWGCQSSACHLAWGTQWAEHPWQASSTRDQAFYNQQAKARHAARVIPEKQMAKKAAAACTSSSANHTYAVAEKCMHVQM
jgi:hypothetical protein